MSRTQHMQVDVKYVKDTAGGAMPDFIKFIHRHFEKALPKGEATGGGEVEFVGPLDLVKLTVPEELLVGVEEVRLVYRRGT